MRASPSDEDRLAIRILLVDDEEMVRRVVAAALRRARYQVIVADSVDGARIVLESDARFQLALVDYSMPGGTGDLLVADLRRRCPNIRVLLFTGGAVDESLRCEVDGVIAKPIRGKRLATLLEAHLAEPSR